MKFFLEKAVKYSELAEIRWEEKVRAETHEHISDCLIMSECEFTLSWIDTWFVTDVHFDYEERYYTTLNIEELSMDNKEWRTYINDITEETNEIVKNIDEKNRKEQHNKDKAKYEELKRKFESNNIS